MKAGKHTEGPHVAKYNFASSRLTPSIEIRDLGGYLLATVPRKGRKFADARPQAEQEANAALFAEAHELLAALQALVIAPNSPASTQRALDAIAKATNTEKP
jgi:hypothetical protein